ncbi:chemotaxis protein histidine kinase CheA [Catenulispora sp. GAS73]|uniref:aggregation-promoting factor C-terminal-like domain-containing protein n=1 Tax=Catenulispora sp. GAS73 TaxID=3156269 RepID=UPI0035125B00
MSSHTGPEHEHNPEHNPTSQDPKTLQDPKSGIAGAASTAAGKTVSFMTAKLPTKTSRIVAAAAAGTMVLAGAGTAYAVHSNDVSTHNRQVAAAQFAAEQKAASDKAAADAATKAAAEKAAADQAAAAAAQKAAADKAAADAAAKAAAQKAAADKAAADQRAAAAAAANRDEQRQQLPTSTTSTPSAPTTTPTQTPTPKPTPTTPKPPAPTGSYGDAYSIAQSMVPSGQFACFSNIVERESGWNVHATNPSSGAYGLGQALPGDKMASAGSDWENNPTTQIKWVLSYMDSRYGSPCGAWSFWQSHSWY